MSGLKLPVSRAGIEKALWLAVVGGIVLLLIGLVIPYAKHVYSYVYGVTLFLPALLLIVVRPGSLRCIWQHRSTRWVVLLLAWSLVSLTWSTGNDAADWSGRCLCIFLFLYAWARVFDASEERIYWLLFACGAIMTTAAVVAFAVYFPQLLQGGRIQAFGKLDNTNDAAAAMSIVAVWMGTLPCRRAWTRIARVAMLVVLLAFVCFTFSRGAWGALFVTALVLLLCRREAVTRPRVWVPLAALVVAGIVAVAVFMPELAERGWSYRPHIMRVNLDLFLAHPWIGVGQGTPVHFYIGDKFIWQAQNMFAQLAVQLGIPGLVLLLCIWLPLGWCGWRHRHEPLGRLLLGSWVFTTVQAQVELPYLINSPSVSWLCAWMPLAISYAFARRRRAESMPPASSEPDDGGVQ